MKYTKRGQIKVHDQQLVNEISQNVFSAARNRKSFIWSFLYSIVFFLIGVAAFISRSFLRKNIGERTIGFFTILLIYPFMWLVYALYNVWPSFIAREEIRATFETFKPFGVEIYDRILFLFYVLSGSTAEEVGITYFLRELAENNIGLIPFDLQILWGLVLAISLIFVIKIIRRNRNDIGLHSFYRGDSCFFEALEGKRILGFQVSSTFIWMIIEPIFVILLSYLIQFAFGLYEMSLILRISAFCLFFEEIRIYSENRNMVLDIRDSNMDAAYIASIQTEHQSESTHSSDGFVGRAIVD